MENKSKPMDCELPEYLNDPNHLEVIARIARLEEYVRHLRGELAPTVKHLDTQQRKFDKKIESLEEKTVALGSNCHKAFLQIREAMHTLREELGEAAGTIIENTWN